jgi:hypothetical protein
MRNVTRPLLAAIALLAFFVLSVAWPSHAQLQQSGGPGSSINVNQVGGTATATGNGTTNAGTQRVTLSSDSTGQVTIAAGSAAIGSITNTGFNVTGSLPAGTNLLGYTRPPNGCGTTSYESGLQNVPNSLTSLTATTTCVAMVSFTNTSGSAATITAFQDQTTNCNSAACQVLASFSVPANSQLILNLQGMKFTSGIKWQAGTLNAITADVIGNQ